MTKTKRIAMWSGPRNISTAMMRAFENRADTWVLDEPYYAYYLDQTGIDHPLHVDIIAAGETSQVAITQRCTKEEQKNFGIQYQKQMCHHMIADTALDWLNQVENCFLIRHPAEVVASYAAKREQISADDLGFRRQAELFDLVTGEFHRKAIVLDTHDILANPKYMLSALCAELEIPFSERMLSWPAGARESDGVWATHWYGAVQKSTGFAAPRVERVNVPRELGSIVDACLPYYEQLQSHKLRP